MKTLKVLNVLSVLALVTAFGAAPGFAQADERHEHRGPHHLRSGMRWDHRYHLDRYYPATGVVVGALPVGALTVRFGGSAWHHHGGVWYRPMGPRFAVSVPPLGVVIPLLPAPYVRLTVGGLPYFYANGTYYAPVSAPGTGYAVVAPPAGVESAPSVVVPSAAVSSTPMAPDPVIYPRNNQSPEQTEFDRQECNRWATTQPAALADASVFQRAVAACMDGRGYTLR